MFGNPGTTELPLMDGLAREPGIRYVLALQESVAIAMADGYAHASGKLAAVNVHISPGLGNAMGMLYDARKAGAPMLLTAGQHDQAYVTEPILWSDLPPVARPYVKWSHEITAWRTCPASCAAPSRPRTRIRAGPSSSRCRWTCSMPSASWTSSPRHAWRPGSAASRGHRGRRRPPRARQAPVIVAGDAVAQGDALAEMAEVAELLGAPVYGECVPSTCAFPFTHPLYAGPFPRLGPPIRNMLMGHDLLFSVGGDLFTLSLPSDVEPMPEG